ncbi:MAG TPA: immunoglobulin domain-containing protein [Verrucomicrobiae bacterium]|nr:immunoglobulin domain-containing protein [Verrucomicrobiae bacterium]
MEINFAALQKQLVIAAIACGPLISFAQSNIVQNGSLEVLSDGSSFVGWTWNNAGGGSFYINEPGAAHGRNHIYAHGGGGLWQDVGTVPGRTYRVRLATKESGNTVAVRWNNLLVGEAVLPDVPFSPWIYTNFLVVADSAVSRLEIVGTAGNTALDDISVGWMEEPPSLTKAVPSRSTFDGGTISFKVEASGAPELRYQWYFAGDPIAGGTNAVLQIVDAGKDQDGEYTVVITNAFGVVQSLPATLLTHRVPNAPWIVSQPRSQQLRSGYYAAFYAVAVGRESLSYQWRWEGTNIPGATNASYAINPVTPAHGGAYSVVVSNHFGTASSTDAILEVETGSGGGYVNWSNINWMGDPPDAPVFDVDGVTRLEGPDFLVQLYTGSTPNALHPATQPIEIGSGELAGYFEPPFLSIPDRLAGQTAHVQVRAWDRNKGGTFEEARARGGRTGSSEVQTVVLSSPHVPPGALEGLQSFSLEAGESLLATAKLYCGGELPGGKREWLLVGDVDAQYLVERRTPPNNWENLVVVTNQTGTVTFVDTNASNASVNFYRARILNP